MHLNHIYHLFIWYIHIHIEHAKMHILQYNKKGSVAWMETIIQYNSNPGWIYKYGNQIQYWWTKLRWSPRGTTVTTKKLQTEGTSTLRFSIQQTTSFFGAINDWQWRINRFASNCPIWVASNWNIKFFAANSCRISDNLTAPWFVSESVKLLKKKSVLPTEALKDQETVVPRWRVEIGALAPVLTQFHSTN